MGTRVSLVVVSLEILGMFCIRGILVQFNTMIARVRYRDVAVRGDCETLRAVQGLRGGVDVGLKRPLGVEDLEKREIETMEGGESGTHLDPTIAPVRDKDVVVLVHGNARG